MKNKPDKEKLAAYEAFLDKLITISKDALPVWKIIKSDFADGKIDTIEWVINYAEQFQSQLKQVDDAGI